MLIDKAKGISHDINNRKIIHELKSAAVFGIPFVTSDWDKYISEQNLLSVLLESWKKEYPAEADVDIEAPIEKYRFCAGHGLSINKKSVIKNLIASLNDIETSKLSIVDGLKEIEENDIDVLRREVDLASFIAQLKDPDLLRLMWQEARTIPFIKKAVVEYCHANQSVIARAWVIIPKSLQKALQNHAADARENK